MRRTPDRRRVDDAGVATVIVSLALVPAAGAPPPCSPRAARRRREGAPARPRRLATRDRADRTEPRRQGSPPALRQTDRRRRRGLRQQAALSRVQIEELLATDERRPRRRGRPVPHQRRGDASRGARDRPGRTAVERRGRGGPHAVPARRAAPRRRTVRRVRATDRRVRRRHQTVLAEDAWLPPPPGRTHASPARPGWLGRLRRDGERAAAVVHRRGRGVAAAGQPERRLVRQLGALPPASIIYGRSPRYVRAHHGRSAWKCTRDYRPGGAAPVNARTAPRPVGRGSRRHWQQLISTGRATPVVEFAVKALRPNRAHVAELSDAALAGVLATGHRVAQAFAFELAQSRPVSVVLARGALASDVTDAHAWVLRWSTLRRRGL